MNAELKLPYYYICYFATRRLEEIHKCSDDYWLLEVYDRHKLPDDYTRYRYTTASRTYSHSFKEVCEFAEEYIKEHMFKWYTLDIKVFEGMG